MLELVLILAIGQTIVPEVYMPNGAIIDKGIFTDVVSHTPPKYNVNKWGNMKTVYCHEMVHQVHAELRRITKRECFYLGANQFVSFEKPPKITLIDVARYVRVEDRGETFHSYFLNSTAQHWNDNPLYLVDEFVAYKLDYRCALEEKIDTHGSRDVIQKFREIYMPALMTATQAMDPTYPEMKKLLTFIKYLQEHP